MIPRHIRWWVLFCSMAATYKIIELKFSQLPWLHSYFEDIIALPVILGCALVSVQLLKSSWRSFTISMRDLALFTLLFALYFELILPRLSDRFTEDPLDVACYLLGGTLFHILINRPWRNDPTAGRSNVGISG